MKTLKYITQFVDAPVVKVKGTLGITVHEVNGDQFVRDISAAMQEKTNEGYRLHSTSSVISTVRVEGPAMTSGMILIFEKIEA
jgi:hypothetical protein